MQCKLLSIWNETLVRNTQFKKFSGQHAIFISKLFWFFGLGKNLHFFFQLLHKYFNYFASFSNTAQLFQK